MGRPQLAAQIGLIRRARDLTARPQTWHRNGMCAAFDLLLFSCWLCSCLLEPLDAENQVRGVWRDGRRAPALRSNRLEPAPRQRHREGVGEDLILESESKQRV